MAKQQVEETIKFYEKLVSEFPSSESWAVNILEASKRLSSGPAQTNFYRYLFDPPNYSFQAEIKLISKTEEDKYNALVKKFDAENLLDVKVYKNGNDMKIIYLPNKDLNAEKKIEPMVGIFKTVQSQEQKIIHENCDEASGGEISCSEEKIDD